MSEKRKNIITVCVIAMFIFGFPLWGLLQEDKTISVSERRPLASFPDISLKNIESGKFMTDFEKYTLDQFPMRDSFRTIKALTALNIFQQKDNNDIYIVDGYAAKLDYPLNEDSIDYAAERFQYVYEKYLKEKNTKVYLAVIPDKNYFLAAENKYPSLDYSEMLAQIQAKMPYATYLDIVSLLEIEDYYRTDSHWRQENIADVAAYLAQQMSAEFNANYEMITAETPFYGVYHGQSALALPGESIAYLTNEIIDNYRVFDYETNKEIPVYNLDKLQGNDPYEMFLSGNKSLVSIENDNSATDKELIIFRDSFGSSLAPLLAQGYSKVTVVDIRYIQPSILDKFIDFDNSDILFMYSTSVLNNSVTLK